MAESTGEYQLQDLADQLDGVLIEAIKAMREGGTLAPNAAVLNVARQRLKDLGFTKVLTGDDPLREFAEEVGMEQATIPFPNADDEDVAVA